MLVVRMELDLLVRCDGRVIPRLAIDGCRISHCLRIVRHAFLAAADGAILDER